MASPSAPLAAEVSTTASSDDEQAAAARQADSQSSAFKFSTEAKEFVPQAFQFNVGAAEFTPTASGAAGSGGVVGTPTASVSSPTAVVPVAMVARPADPSGRGSPSASPQHQFAMPMQVLSGGGVHGMVPVVAVQALRPAGAGKGATMYVAPLGHVAGGHQVMGFQPVAFHHDATGAVSPQSAAVAANTARAAGAGGAASPVGSPQGGAASDASANRGAKGPGKAYRGLGQKGQAGYFQGSRGGWQENGAKSWGTSGNGRYQASSDELLFNQAPEASSEMVLDGEEAKEEDGEDENGEPKKTTWADMFRKSVKKEEPSTPPAGEGARTLPKRVTKAKPGAHASAPPVVVPKAVRWGPAQPAPKAQAATPAQDLSTCPEIRPASAEELQPAVPAQAEADSVAETLAPSRLPQRRPVPTAHQTPATAAAPPATPPATLPASVEAEAEPEATGAVAEDAEVATQKSQGESTSMDGEQDAGQEKRPPSWADRLFKKTPSAPSTPDAAAGAGGAVAVITTKRPDISSAPALAPAPADGEVFSGVRQDLLQDSPTEKAEVDVVGDCHAEGAHRGLTVDTEDLDNEEEEGAVEVGTEVAEGNEKAGDLNEEEEEETKDAEDDEEDVEQATAPTASLKLAAKLGKPDAGGVIRYSVQILKSMADVPASKGSCPPSIPQYLRHSEDAEEVHEVGSSPRKRYTLEFLMQFEKKVPCQELPTNSQIPKDLRAVPAPLQRDRDRNNPSGNAHDEDRHDEEDDWRVQQVKHQAQMKNLREKEKPARPGRDRQISGNSGKRGDDAVPRLQASENSWATQQKALKDDNEVVTRKMKAILNKLTVEKFDALYQQLLECGIETKEHIESLMREVFEKATTQHHFIEMYTCLCIRLNDWLSGDRGLSDKTDKNEGFKRILLNQCQDSFEKYLKPPEGIQELAGEEQYEAKVKYKTRMLGNMKFVGQLLIHKVLSSKIILQCIEELLFYASEETLETLCAFLVTIGPTYDIKEWRCHEALNQKFLRVKDLTTDKTIPARIRCLLKDVLDLRGNGWSRKSRPHEPDGPMRMAEVKTQWAKDMAAVQDRRTPGGARSSPSSAGAGQDCASPSHGGSSSAAAADWETVGAAPRKGPKSGTQPSIARSVSSQVQHSSSWQERDGGTDKRGGRTGATSKKDAEAGWRKVELQRAKTAPLETAPRPSEARSSPSSGGGASSAAPSSASNAVEGLSSGKDPFEEAHFILNELAYSHDIDEALQRGRDLKVMQKQQKDFIADLIGNIVEKRAGDRPSCWTFLARVVTQDTRQHRTFREGVMLQGIDKFLTDVYEDLKVDVPQLPAILKEEFFPAAEAASALTALELAEVRDRIQ